MKTYTDDEIVRALECCGNMNECKKECPLDDLGGIDKCIHTLMLNALDLIKRQQAEIEKLNSLVKEMSDYFPCCIDCEGKTTLGERTDKCVFRIDDTYCATRGLENMVAIKKENQELKAEIKELQEILGGTAKVQSQTCAVERVKAVREFAEKIKKKLQFDLAYGFLSEDIFENDIDELVRKMTEGES